MVVLLQRHQSIKPRIKFVCVTMYPLVTNLYSHDVSLNQDVYSQQ